MQLLNVKKEVRLSSYSGKNMELDLQETGSERNKLSDKNSTVESFERIHRSNLIGMSFVLQFK